MTRARARARTSLKTRREMGRTTPVHCHRSRYFLGRRALSRKMSIESDYFSDTADGRCPVKRGRETLEFAHPGGECEARHVSRDPIRHARTIERLPGRVAVLRSLARGGGPDVRLCG